MLLERLNGSNKHHFSHSTKALEHFSLGFYKTSIEVSAWKIAAR